MSDSLLDALLEESFVVLSSMREVNIAIRRDGDPSWSVGKPLLGDGSPENALDGNTIANIARAVQVHGEHIYLHRIKAINFGAKSSSPMYGVITAAGEVSEDCVIEDCVCEEPSTNAANDGKLAFFRFAGSSNYPHRFCVIRNSAGRGVTSVNTPFDPPPALSDKYRAISPGYGIGTIVEGNQFADLAIGVEGTSLGTQDLVIWNNYFRNVWKGISYSLPPNTSVGRIIASQNIFELGTNLNGMSNPTGILISGADSGQYSQMILRKSVIRDVNNPYTPPITTGMRGIDISLCANAIVEDNIIHNIGPQDAVRFQNCGAAKFLNNQDAGGNLLQGFNLDTNRRVLELEDTAEDALIAI